MGAAGITCSSSEMSAAGNVGMKIDLDKVPTRQSDMKDWEILLSESQERMLVVVEKGKELNQEDSSKLDSAIATVTPDSLACLIFTSGTTGKPKGVMISHKNVLWTIESLFGQMIPATKFPRIVSYLPMAHIAARAGDHYQAIYRVCLLYTSPSPRDGLLSRMPSSA